MSQLAIDFAKTNGMMSRNIVSTVNLDCKLDLKAIALQARNAEYNPKVSNRAWRHVFVFVSFVLVFPCFQIVLLSG